MKNLKKLLALLLALAVLLSMAACGSSDSDGEKTSDDAASEEEQKEEEKKESAAVAEAKALIEKGELQKAYDLLKVIKEPSKEEETMLKSFWYLPLEIKTNEIVQTFTYNKDGLPLTERRAYTDGSWWEEAVYTYDDKGNELTQIGTDSNGNRSGNTDKSARCRLHHRWRCIRSGYR